jgi:cobalt-precorrin 5A hydrolase
MIVAGIGCRLECSADEIVALVDEALAAIAEPRSRLSALAAPAFRTEADGPRKAAEELGLPLLFVTDSEMKAAEPRTVTASEHALEAKGFSSVAECAALAGAGEDSTLILPRIKSRSATCALAKRGQP